MRLLAVAALLCSAAAFAQQPVVVSVEGDWSAEAVAAGYDYLSFEGQGDYDAIVTALRDRGVGEGRALLVGGSANLARLVALDRQADRAFGMVVASADLEQPDAINNGEFGWNALSGTYWLMTADPAWVTRFGGVVERVDDPRALALRRFATLLDLRKSALPSATQWQVRRDPDLEIPSASIPNAGLIGSDVWLTMSGQRVLRGGNIDRVDLSPYFAGTEYRPTEVIPREGPVWFVLGMLPPGTNRAAVFRVMPPRFAELAFEGPEEDGRFPGVPDVVDLGDGRLRLFYVARGASPQNSRTALSEDAGRTFRPEFANPFGDAAIPEPKGTDLNVDPAVLKLNDGAGYLGVTMRGARLYVFNSLDGRTFAPTGQAAIEPEELSPGATGLFDPTLVQTPDGRVWMYVTAGSGPTEAQSRIVRAELTPVR